MSTMKDRNIRIEIDRTASLVLIEVRGVGRVVTLSEWSYAISHPATKDLAAVIGQGTPLTAG